MNLNEFNEKVLEIKEHQNLPNRNGFCRVIIINATPQDWGAVITIVGSKFFYTDNTNWTQGGVQVHLVTGQQTTLTSNEPSKCVYQAQTFIQVNFPDGSNTILQAVSNRDSPTSCLVEAKLTLKPKSSVPEEALKNLRLADLVEMG